MSFPDIYQQFIDGMKNTTWLEYLAVFFGVASVLFSRIENIWVYPTGLINTILYTYFCFIWGLYAEASLNFYYTVMSVYGWILWARRKKETHEKELHITASNKKEWVWAILFFVICYDPCNKYNNTN